MYQYSGAPLTAAEADLLEEEEEEEEEAVEEDDEQEDGDEGVSPGCSCHYGGGGSNAVLFQTGENGEAVEDGGEVEDAGQSNGPAAGEQTTSEVKPSTGSTDTPAPTALSDNEVSLLPSLVHYASIQFVSACSSFSLCFSPFIPLSSTPFFSSLVSLA